MGTEGIWIPLLIGATVGAGTAAATGAFSGGQSTPEVQPTPPAPDTKAIAAEAKQQEVTAMKKRMGRAKTILTSPQGETSAAPIGMKTLLGE